MTKETKATLYNSRQVKITKPWKKEMGAVWLSELSPVRLFWLISRPSHAARLSSNEVLL